MSINLEITTTGMAAPDENGDRHCADRPEDVQDYTVDLRAIHFDSGEIEVLFEREDLDAVNAERTHEQLEAMFPHADSEWLPCEPQEPEAYLPDPDDYVEMRAEEKAEEEANRASSSGPSLG